MTKTIFVRCRSAAVSLICVGLVMEACAPALAQDQKFGAGLEEIVVTAQRRAESLQRVPIAIAAFGPESIENNAINDLNDLTGRAPGVFFRPVNSAMPNIYVRGIGSTQADNTSDQSTGVFQDEVYLARHSALSAEVFDVERIEVLRGPQGTLYGRNTIGGAINVISQAPTDVFEGYLGASVSEYSGIATRGAISGPLSEGIAGRLAFVTNQRDGYSTNPVTRVDANDADTVAARGRLRFDAGERLTVNVSVDGTRDRAGPYEAKILGTMSLAGNIQSDPSGLSSQRSIQQPYVTHANRVGHQIRDLWGAMLRADYELSDALTLTSISAYRASESDQLRDGDNGPAEIFAFHDLEDADQVSQELRLAYDGSGRIRAIGGLYYLTEDSTRSETWDFLLGSASPVGGIYNWSNRAQATNYAAFAQVDVDVLDALTVTLGLRYSHDRKDAAFDVSSTAAVPNPGFINDELAFDTDPGNENFVANVEKSWHSLDPAVTFNWHVAPDVMLYASYKEGFKSGGFQTRAISPSFVARAFDPETLKAFEGGVRSDWLSGRLRINASLFRYDYQNLQVINFIGSTTYVDNIGQATIDGAELELTVRPAGAWQLDAALTYLDAVMDEYTDSVGNDFSGNRLPRAPEYAANVATEYTLQTPLGALTGRVEYNWRDEQFYLVNNNPIDRARSAGVLNARVSLAAANERLKVAVFGNNLTEEVFCANYTTGVPATVNGMCQVSEPRQLGLSVLYNFH